MNETMNHGSPFCHLGRTTLLVPGLASSIRGRGHRDLHVVLPTEHVGRFFRTYVRIDQFDFKR